MTSGKLTEDQRRRIHEALETVPFAKLIGKISYLCPLETGRARATARVLRAGRRVVVVSAEVSDEGQNLAATALSTYLRLPTSKGFP